MSEEERNKPSTPKPSGILKYNQLQEGTAKNSKALRERYIGYLRGRKSSKQHGKGLDSAPMTQKESASFSEYKADRRQLQNTTDFYNKANANSPFAMARERGNAPRAVKNAVLAQKKMARYVRRAIRDASRRGDNKAAAELTKYGVENGLQMGGIAQAGQAHVDMARNLQGKLLSGMGEIADMQMGLQQPAPPAVDPFTSPFQVPNFSSPQDTGTSPGGGTSPGSTIGDVEDASKFDLPQIPSTIGFGDSGLLPNSGLPSDQNKFNNKRRFPSPFPLG